MKKIAAAGFFLAFCFAIVGFAQTSTDKKTFQLKGVFKDETGAVITGLYLYFEKSGKKINSVTDENGEFKVDLPAGEYTLTIDPAIAKNFTSQVKILEKGHNPNKLKFMVIPDLKCCQTVSGEAFPKPISLPKPPYPPAAWSVHANGNVIVAVKIDKEGKVITAQVVSGHPLLWQAGAAAAKQSLFVPSENSAEHEAILTYVFLLPANKKKSVRHYSNPYRIIMIGTYGVVNT